MIISLSNTLTTQQSIQQTYVSTGISAGGTSSPVRNNTGFTTNFAVQLGQTGEETAEIMVLAGASGTILTFGTSPSHIAGTLLFSHAQDTPIYQIHYDQLIVNRSTTGTAGVFSIIGTVSLQPDSQYTQFNDPTGVGTYAYCAQYYNSVSGDTSGSSSIFTPGGPSFYSLQRLRSRTKDKLYSAGYIKNDSLIDDWLNEWAEVLTNAAISVNEDYMLGTANYSFGTAGLGTVTDSSFKQPIKLEVTYDSVTYIPSTKMAVRSYTESDNFNISAPRHAWLGETVFQIQPHNQAGTVKMTYSQRFTPLVNDSDELSQTLKSYTTSFTEYCLSVAYGLDQKDGESQQHYALAEKGKQDFINEIAPRDMTGAETIDINESISGMDDSILGEYGDFVW